MFMRVLLSLLRGIQCFHYLEIKKITVGFLFAGSLTSYSVTEEELMYVRPLETQ